WDAWLGSLQSPGLKILKWCDSILLLSRQAIVLREGYAMLNSMEKMWNQVLHGFMALKEALSMPLRIKLALWIEGEESHRSLWMDILMIFLSSPKGNLERSITATDDLDNVDLEANMEYREFPGMYMPIPKGFSSVVNELVNRLPVGSIMYNARVESIEWSCEGRSRAVLLKGPDIVVDHVILTVSLGVLKSCIKGCKKNDVDSGKDVAEGLGFGGFQPLLPSWKVDAIRRLGFGVVDKVHMQFSSAVSDVTCIIFLFGKQQNGDGHLGGIPWWMRKTYSLLPTHNNSRIFASWLVGKEAIQMESLSD
ncbi:hypothetical protein KI387_036248, partial [Taxus chinensis]